jgi:uncharacterized protein (DUF885 family)
VATGLGDHRFDGLLPDLSPDARTDERRALHGLEARLTAIEPSRLTAEERADAAMMASSIARRGFELDELRERSWSPLVANPGRAVYLVLARDFAPLPDRLAAAASRLAAIPAALAAGRAQLRAMPRVHLETAISQFAGTITLVSGIPGLPDGPVFPGIPRTPPSASGRHDAAMKAAAADIGRARPAALAALAQHRDWLSARLEDASFEGGFADPRLGPERFARKLSLTLQAQADAAAILARAEADLDRVTEQITELAGSFGGTPREVLDRLAQDVPDASTILSYCGEALSSQTGFVRQRNLLTVFDDPVELIDMPELDRGVSVAYCDSPGPLEEGALPTFIAVSPVPRDWSAPRIASFYREYNRHMVHNLMVHEAMPGHYLQLAHARRFTASGTELRAALQSESFVEGWAVYAEELMAAHGYPGEGDPRAVRMQQLKMQLRMIINAILDARVHAHDMTEAQAMALMTERGFQEEGEAAGKWRRALLTSAQLSAYYVGYTEVSDLARELLAEPGAELRDVHDRMLAHGSPPVRLLRTVL